MLIYNEIFIFIVLFIIFLANEKYSLFSYVNLLSFRNIIRNIIVILPIITVYLNQDNVIKLFYKSRTNKKKRNVTESTKKFVAANQRWKCSRCFQILDATYEIDHIIPLYKGGNNEISNLQAMCRNCHGKKTLYDKLN